MLFIIFHNFFFSWNKWTASFKDALCNFSISCLLYSFRRRSDFKCVFSFSVSFNRSVTLFSSASIQFILERYTRFCSAAPIHALMCPCVFSYSILMSSRIPGTILCIPCILFNFSMISRRFMFDSSTFVFVREFHFFFFKE